MNTNFKKDFLSVLILLCVFFMFACNQKTTDNKGEVQKEETKVTKDDKGESMKVDPSMMKGEVKASDSTYPIKDEYIMNTMGLKFSLDGVLKSELEKKNMVMLCEEFPTEDGKDIGFAQFSFYKMNDEQKNRMVKKMGNEYTDWVNELEKIGSIGLIRKADEKHFNEITKNQEMNKIGESKDGSYIYYIGKGNSEDKNLVDSLLNTKSEIIEKAKFNGMSAFDGPKDAKSSSNILPLSTEDIDGNKFSDENIKSKKLTLVNVFATWCTACIKEIPDLNKIQEEYKDKGLNIVGVILDTVEAGGENKEAIDKSKILRDKLKINYDLIKPDKTMMNGRLEGIYALPESFFVDENGNIISEAISGSRDFDGWKKIVEENLKKIK